MDPVTISALIGASVSIGQSLWGAGSQREANRAASAESANDAVRQYNELLRQKRSAAEQFNTTIQQRYGQSFLDKIRSGADTSSLIESLSQGNTAFAKQLQAYSDDAKQSMENSMVGNQQAGMLAGIQGDQNALSVLQQAIQAEQSQGAAIASQAASGIRSDRGTGSNSQTIQEQANRLAEESLLNSINAQNTQTVFGMKETQMTASQTASKLRRQADISAQEAKEQALIEWGSYNAKQEDLSASMDSFKKDYEYYKDKADDGVNWFNSLFGADDYTGDINETFDKFEDDEF